MLPSTYPYIENENKEEILIILFQIKKIELRKVGNHDIILKLKYRNMRR